MIRDSVGHYGLRTSSDDDERFTRGVPVRRERFARGGRGDAGDSGVQPLRARVGAADAEVQVGVCSCGVGGGLCHPTILSQGNRYIASPDLAAKEVTHRDYVAEAVWRTWTWRSEGDLMMNGAFFVEAGSAFTSKFTKQEKIRHFCDKAHFCTEHPNS
ncbi:hypothetical protein KSP40_PGU002815 [Platanthera guangdongensis]|uniref:Uncharacterized protein n=1 Tax=Platanthera guangdongensis TaxID=2320717 RepID=A0ABR2LH66_9ASPA